MKPSMVWVTRWFQIFAGMMCYWHIVLFLSPGVHWAATSPILPCVGVTTLLGWPVWLLCHLVLEDYRRTTVRASAEDRRFNSTMYKGGEIK